MSGPEKVRRSRDPKVVQARILDAALREFMSEGFAGASTNRILLGFAGSKPTMFRHFPTKRALFEGVVARIAGDWAGQVRPEALDAASPEAWLGGFALAALDWLLGPENLFIGRMAVAEGAAFPELVETYRTLAVRPIEAAVAARLAGWTAAGILACAEPEADAVSFLDLTLSGVISRALYGVGVDRDPQVLGRHVQRCVALFLDGRRPRGGTSEVSRPPRRVGAGGGP